MSDERWTNDELMMATMNRSAQLGTYQRHILETRIVSVCRCRCVFVVSERWEYIGWQRSGERRIVIITITIICVVMLLMCIQIKFTCSLFPSMALLYGSTRLYTHELICNRSQKSRVKLLFLFPLRRRRRRRRSTIQFPASLRHSAGTTLFTDSEIWSSCRARADENNAHFFLSLSLAHFFQFDRAQWN